MKQTHLNIALFILLGISTCFIYKFYNQNKLLVLKINTISNTISEKNLGKKDSLLSVLEFQKTKEEYYTSQLSIQSDWIIFYVTILFGIFGIIGFTFYQNSIKEIKDNFESQLINIKTETNDLYIEHKKELLEIEKTLYLGYAEAQRAAALAVEEPFSKFLYCLSASYYFGKVFNLEVDNDIKARIVRFLLGDLEVAYVSLRRSDINERTKERLNKEIKQINKRLSELSTLDSEKAKEFCAKIQVQIISCLH